MKPESSKLLLITFLTHVETDRDLEDSESAIRTEGMNRLIT